MMRTRKVPALKLALCAIFGAAVTVLLAWTAGAHGYLLPWRDNYRGIVAPWPAPAPAGWPVAPDYTNETMFLGGDERNSVAGGFDMIRTRTGFPLRSFGYFLWRRTTGATQVYEERGKMPAWMPDLGFFEPPAAILWPGFLFDTAFYAALAFSMWSAPSFVRRRARKRRGACPACGYDLRTSAQTGPCPECGDAAP